MWTKGLRFLGVGRGVSTWLAGLLIAAAGAGCGDADSGNTPLTEIRGSLTANQRLSACNQDPRVVTGLVTAQVCAGADIFFRETFGGNGRACGTCHPAENNTTIDTAFVTQLHATNPTDPLFVFETNPALANLEKRDNLLGNAVILENVDGFEDPVNKFVLRSVPHVLSMALTIGADTGDGTTIPPIERTGWGGDGSPGDGSLRSFLTGAVTQHYTKTLARVAGTDFRLPTAQELDLTNTFQRALGRLNELDLTQVNLFDAEANTGRQAFIDPQRGRCNVCHSNAGANFIDTHKNRNFDTMTRIATAGVIGTFDGQPFFDAGFGGQGLLHPNFDALLLGFNNSLGNGTFSPPPLVEAADTAPFFHNNAFGSEIEDAVFFYLGPFSISPAAAELTARFGTPINFSTPDGFAIGRFLRALNVAFNLDIAKQRGRAAQTLYNRFRDTRVDVQIKLLQLARNELDDALFVLTSNKTTQPFYPVAIDRIGLAKQEIDAAVVAPASSRGGRISNAISRIENARDTIGANITFQLGAGNLMF
jgi:hypothetical protein